MTLKKRELVEMLYDRTDLRKRECKRLVDAVFEIIRDELAGSGEVRISGFGKWYVIDKEARKGRNPQTGAALTLKARKTVKFRSSDLLRTMIRRQQEDVRAEQER